MKKELMLTVAAFLSGFTAAQQCDLASPATTLFEQSQKGIVDQPAANLQWLKCNLGETYNGTTCSGTATFLDFVEAKKVSEGFTQLGYSDWRLPTKEELLALVETQCSLPAASLTYFPTMQSQQYWSSERYSFFAHVVSFDYGYTFSTQMSVHNAVRLVRLM